MAAPDALDGNTEAKPPGRQLGRLNNTFGEANGIRLSEQMPSGKAASIPSPNSSLAARRIATRAFPPLSYCIIGCAILGALRDLHTTVGHASFSMLRGLLFLFLGCNFPDANLRTTSRISYLHVAISNPEENKTCHRSGQVFPVLWIVATAHE